MFLYIHVCTGKIILFIGDHNRNILRKVWNSVIGNLICVIGSGPVTLFARPANVLYVSIFLS